MCWKIVLALFIIFEGIDAGLTAYGIQVGILEEANPLVAAVIEYSGLLWGFIFLKGVSCGLGYFLFLQKNYFVARLGLLLLTIVAIYISTYNAFLLIGAG